MQWIDPPGGRPWALIGLCGGSLLLNVILFARLAMVGGGTAPASAVVVEEPTGMEVTEASIASLPVIEEPEQSPAEAAGLLVATATVDHSLARTFQGVRPEHADVLSQVTARLFFWDLDLRRDLQVGDQVSVAYSWDGALADISAAKYDSKKLGRTLTSYKFQATGDKYASWWSADGTETAYRLKASPLTDYEQITSLIKDRPTHHGMDFKVPMGTEVTTPLAGTVVRTDWNWKFNGNCVEIRYADGTLARFLHLSETRAKEGQHLAAGSVVGLSGNTGHSTAPHLHYELERNGEVVDPVDYHGTVRRTLPAGDLPAFHDEVSRLDRVLSSES